METAQTLAESRTAVQKIDSSVSHLIERSLTGSKIHDAACLGQVEKVQAALESGIDADLKDRYGFAPLHKAAQFGHLEVIRFRVEAGANVDVVTKTRAAATPLHYAAGYGQPDAVRLLLELGADPSIIDGAEKPPLDWATSARSYASAFVGSHNVTAFALGGLNGEAAVLLEGDKTEQQFVAIREHIAEAARQALRYTPDLKAALAWWTKEYLDGLQAEMGIPHDWTSTRTIVILASTDGTRRPNPGDTFYFELPAGIQQIESLKTPVHLFLFTTLPADPWQALARAGEAAMACNCIPLGADNQQGIEAIRVRWNIDGNRSPVLRAVPGGSYQPVTSPGNQQVHARIEHVGVEAFDYQLEKEKVDWAPVYGDEVISVDVHDVDKTYRKPDARDWQLVRGLEPKHKVVERDQAALKLASPESGSFVLVSLGRRKRSRDDEEPVD